jgi:S1-C subfamily serine protease
MTWVVGELMTDGRVHRAVLGIVGQNRPVNRRLQREFGLSAATAVEIVSLLENGPARRAGLRERDVIVAMDGKGISSIDDLQRVLARTSAGSVLRIVVLRHGGHRHEIAVTPVHD